MKTILNLFCVRGKEDKLESQQLSQMCYSDLDKFNNTEIFYKYRTSSEQIVQRLTVFDQRVTGQRST